MLAAGLLGLDALAGRWSRSQQVEIGVALKKIRQLQDLVVLRVPVQFIHDSAMRGRLGGIACLLDVQGQADLGVDLSRATLTDVDHAARTATLQLPPARPLNSRLDLQATRILRLERIGLWQILPTPAGERQLLQRAMTQCESALRRLAHDEDLLDHAHQRARALCIELARQLGWTLR